MADILNETQIKEVQDAFCAVDTDSDGIIMAGELGAVLRLLGENPSDADLQVRKYYPDQLCSRHFWQLRNFLRNFFK
jgi:hypothetical protein